MLNKWANGIRKDDTLLHRSGSRRLIAIMTIIFNFQFLFVILKKLMLFILNLKKIKIEDFSI